MDVFRFRAWHLELHIMFYFTFGDLLGFDDGCVYIDPECEIEITDKNLIIMRSNFLVDKNQKDMYEFDFIKATLPEIYEGRQPLGPGYDDEDHDDVYFPERTIVGEVQIRKTRGTGFVYRKDIPMEGNDEPEFNLKNKWFKIHTKTDEIIGNKFENPEIIK